jgi:hypothetical protein
MAGALYAVAVAAVILTISPSAQQLSEDIKPMATRAPVALYIKLCLWSEQWPAVRREVPLTRGAAGPALPA